MMKPLGVLILSLSLLSYASTQTTNKPVVNTPVQLTTCQNASLTWTGAPPGNVFVSAVPGGQPAVAPLVQFNATDSSKGAITWLVDLAADTSVTILMTDSTGQTTGSAPVVVKKGVDTSCVGKGQSAHPGTGSTSAPTSGASSSTTKSSNSTAATSPATSGNSAPTFGTTSTTTTPSSTSSDQGGSSSDKTNASTTTAKNTADGAATLQGQLSLGAAALAISILFMAL